MYVFKAGLSFLLIICVVKSDGVDNRIQCNDYYKDMNNKPINVTHYCNNKSCIIKCCGDGEILKHGECITVTRLEKLYSQINYSNVPIYSWERSALKKSNKNLLQDFVFIQNEKFTSLGCQFKLVFDGFYILKDGSIKTYNKNAFTPWIDTQRWDYCVDFQFHAYRAENGTLLQELLFIFRQSLEPDSTSDINSNFFAIGMLVSCFFLLFVLAVYCLLDQLRNIMGMIVMAYSLSLFVSFLLKAIMILNISNFNITPNGCKIISPILYYAALSNLFWLTIMSFEIWWSIRRVRKYCVFHRHGDLVRFGWYSFYALGAPLGLTIAAVILDKADLTAWPSILKPSFDSCLRNEHSTFYYVLLPMVIMSIVKLILFLMTAYNIWRIKCSLRYFRNSSGTIKEENRFKIYKKLAVMTGVIWTLEASCKICVNMIYRVPQWLFYITNFYNVHMGVVIFFLFVFKKSILNMLSKRFGIKKQIHPNSAIALTEARSQHYF